MLTKRQAQHDFEEAVKIKNPKDAVMKLRIVVLQCKNTHPFAMTRAFTDFIDKHKNFILGPEFKDLMDKEKDELYNITLN